MTAQVPDTLLYNDKPYDLTGMEGSGLPSPDDFGMQPVMMHTACYRGFYCTYVIRDEQLYLSGLTVRSESGEYPPVNGVHPQIDPYGTGTYEDIHLPVSFSGRLRLGGDFIQNEYIHMGFQSPSAYKTVLELAFEGGHLVSVTDRCEEFARLRKKPQRPKPRSLMDWVHQRFSRDMDKED